jgi:hypothetical protein
MRKDKESVSGKSKNLHRDLLEADQAVSEDSLFRDDLFEDPCEEIGSQNHSRYR